jgi:hypothetical protein
MALTSTRIQNRIEWMLLNFAASFTPLHQRRRSRPTTPKEESVEHILLLLFQFMPHRAWQVTSGRLQQEAWSSIRDAKIKSRYPIHWFLRQSGTGCNDICLTCFYPTYQQTS